MVAALALLAMFLLHRRRAFRLAAANVYLDPDGSSSVSGWTDNTNIHLKWDDAVRSPVNARTGGDGAHPGNSTVFGAPAAQATLEFGTAAFGTVTQIKAWAYLLSSAASTPAKWRLTILFGGVSQSASAQTNVTSEGWVSHSYSPGVAPSQSDMDSLQVKIEVWTGSEEGDVQPFCYAVYVQVTQS